MLLNLRVAIRLVDRAQVIDDRAASLFAEPVYGRATKLRIGIGARDLQQQRQSLAPAVRADDGDDRLFHARARRGRLQHLGRVLEGALRVVLEEALQGDDLDLVVARVVDALLDCLRVAHLRGERPGLLLPARLRKLLVELGEVRLRLRLVALLVERVGEPEVGRVNVPVLRVGRDEAAKLLRRLRPLAAVEQVAPLGEEAHGGRRARLLHEAIQLLRVLLRQPVGRARPESRERDGCDGDERADR